MKDLVLVTQPGGMRNVVLAGVLYSWDVTVDRFQGIYACSSSAATLAFWMAGQKDFLKELWLEVLLREQMFQKTRLPPADIDYLVDVGCKQLDRDALFACGVPLTIAVFNPLTGQTEYIVATPENLTELLKATVAIPLATRKAFINDAWYCDGAIRDVLPPIEMFDGYNTIYILNRSLSEFPEEYWWLQRKAAFPNHPQAVLAPVGRRERYSRICQVLAENSDDRLVIAPIQPLGIKRFERNQRKVEAGFQYGQGLAAALTTKIHARVA